MRLNETLLNEDPNESTSPKCSPSKLNNLLKNLAPHTLFSSPNDLVIGN